MTDSTSFLPSPVDSAFLGGSRLLGDALPLREADSVCQAVCLPDILSVASAILCVIFLKRLYCALPSMVACLFRWKEALNLEYSVGISRDRNLFFILMVIPMSVLLDRYSVYSPDFLDFIPSGYGVVGIFACLSGYILLRSFLFRTARGKKMQKEAYVAAGGLFKSFFSVATLLLIVVAGVLSRAGVQDGTVRTIILCVLSVFWLILLLRKGQIFAHTCTIFSTILYLCTLEIVPTGLLVASAMLL